MYCLLSLFLEANPKNETAILEGMHILLLFIFLMQYLLYFTYLFLSSLHAQRGAWTRDPKIKSRLL